ncbi:hypothetical protein CC80DRAFT_29157 [Byssothecium circinans]|uniref:Uncharacterized protein n=1 Tax=Byssothecium circinans TaxID=147558 RepID=A0A6A5UB67_9PLEO|nr:hypothetical protein CC80DRAFT_29157 [Byssothecium circinans]
MRPWRIKPKRKYLSNSTLLLLRHAYPTHQHSVGRDMHMSKGYRYRAFTHRPQAKPTTSPRRKLEVPLVPSPSMDWRMGVCETTPALHFAEKMPVLYLWGTNELMTWYTRRQSRGNEDAVRVCCCRVAIWGDEKMWGSVKFKKAVGSTRDGYGGTGEMGEVSERDLVVWVVCWLLVCWYAHDRVLEMDVRLRCRKGAEGKEETVVFVFFGMRGQLLWESTVVE